MGRLQLRIQSKEASIFDGITEGTPIFRKSQLVLKLSSSEVSHFNGKTLAGMEMCKCECHIEWPQRRELTYQIIGLYCNRLAYRNSLNVAFAYNLQLYVAIQAEMSRFVRNF